MFERAEIAPFLRTLAKNANYSNQEAKCILLGQTLQSSFPQSATFMTEYEVLRKRIQKKPDEKTLTDLKTLADAAAEYLSAFGPRSPPTLGEHDQSEVVQLVDQAYHQSRLFSVTKWILAISLSLLGIGSLGYAGVNFLIMDRVQTAQDRAASATKQLTDLANTLNLRKDEIDKSAVKALSDVQMLLNRESGEITQKFEAALNKVTEKLGTEAKTATETIAAANKTASEAIDKQKNGSVAELQAATEKSKGKFDSDIAAQLNVVVAAANKGVQSVIDETTKATTSLSNQLQKNKNDLDQALKNDVGELQQELEKKMPDLNRKSVEVLGRLDAIVSVSEAAEAQFTNGLKQHLASWNQGIDDGTARVATLAKSLADVKSEIDGLDQKLVALERNSTAALELAEKLSSGTKTENLQWIGTVLERSAAFLLGIVGLAGFSVLLSALSLYRQRRHRLHGHAPAASV